MALRIAEAGYVTLTLEHRGMGYLRLLGPPGDDMDFWPHVGYLLMHGRSLMGRLAADVAGGLSYLARRPEIDPDRLGVVGMSLGGKVAAYLTALDERVRVVVTSGAVTSHRANHRFALHGPEDAVPGLGELLGFGDVMGLIAPRPLLVHWGEEDNLRAGRSASYNEGSMPTFEVAQEIYTAAGASDRISYHLTAGLGHEFDNEAAIAFLRRWMPPE